MRRRGRVRTRPLRAGTCRCKRRAPRVVFREEVDSGDRRVRIGEERIEHDREMAHEGIGVVEHRTRSVEVEGPIPRGVEVMYLEPQSMVGVAVTGVHPIRSTSECRRSLRTRH